MKSIKSPQKVILAIFAFVFVATLSFLLTKNHQSANAADLNNFKAGNIISDYTMGNFTTMSVNDIQNFLNSKVSCSDYDLKKTNAGGYNWEDIDYTDASGVTFNYRIHFKYIVNGEWYYTYANYHIKDGHYVCIADERFNGQSAAEIIYNAAQTYRINPRVLLVLLQKEQGLITDRLPNSGQYRSATGYGCPDTDVCDSQYYGFKNQLENAAALFRYILDNGSRYKPVGNNYIQYNPSSSCGGSTVYIENRATASLYQYTPYQPNQAALNAGYGSGDACSAYGNRNFYLYFSDWFGDPTASAEVHSVVAAPGTYALKTVSDKSLSFSGVANGSGAQISDFNNSDSQKFTLEWDGYRYYRLRNVASGRYLDVNNAETKDGTSVQLWDGNDTCAQKWTLEIIDTKAYRLRNACSYKSLDISGGNINTNGTKVQIWTGNDSNAQQWILTNLDNAPVENGTYNLTTTGNKALALSKETTANGTKIVIGDRHSATTERFQITRGADGYYRLKNLASGRYLDVVGANNSDGTSVQIYDGNISCAQRWAIKQANSGFALLSACSGKALDVNNAEVSSENAKVQIWTSNGSNAQTWYFKAPSGRTLDDGTYSISSKINTSYQLDADGSKWPSNGTNIQLWSKNDTNSQKYTITYNEATGYYVIKNLFTERNLDVSGASKTSGANVQAWSANDSCAQKWMIISDGDSYRILSGCSRLSLDTNGGLAQSGTNIQLWSRNSSNAQKWQFNQTSATKQPQVLPDGTYSIQSSIKSSQYLDVAGATARNGTNVQIWSKNETDAQKFQLTFDSNLGYYTIKNLATGLSLDLNGATTKNSTNIQIWSSNDTCAQKWQITKLGEDTYRIASACNNGLSLDVNNASSESGTNVQLWQNNDTIAQKWQITKL